MAEPARTAHGKGEGVSQEGSLHSVQAALRQMMGQASGTQLTDQAGFRSQLQALLSQLDSIGPSQNELQNDEGEAVIDIREGEDESNAMLLHPRASEPPSRQQRTAHCPSARSGTNEESSSSLKPGASARQFKLQSKEQTMLDDEIFARLDRLMEEEQAAGSSSEEDDDEKAAEQYTQPSGPDSGSGPQLQVNQEFSSAAAAPGLFMPAALSLDDDSDEGVDILPAFLPAALSLDDYEDSSENKATAAGSKPSRPAALSETQLHDLLTDPHHKMPVTQPSHTFTAQPSSAPSPSNSRPLSSKPYSVLHVNSTSATPPSSSTTVPSPHAPATVKQHPPTSADSSSSPVSLSQPSSQSTNMPINSPAASPSPPVAPAPQPQIDGGSAVTSSKSSGKGSSLRRGFFPASRAPPQSPAVQQTTSTSQAAQAGMDGKTVSSPAPPTPASVSSGRRVSFSSDCATESAEDKSVFPSSSGSGSQPSSSRVMQAVAEQDASVFTGQVMEHSSRDRQEALTSSNNSRPVVTGVLDRSVGSKGVADADCKSAAAVGGDPSTSEPSTPALPAAPMSKFKQRRLGLA